MVTRESARSADLWATHRTDPESPPLKNPAVKNQSAMRGKSSSVNGSITCYTWQPILSPDPKLNHCYRV